MITFQAHITVGIEGLALTKIEANLLPEVKPLPDSYYTPRDAILEDINSWSLGDWFHYNVMPKMSDKEEKGNFVVDGCAWWCSTDNDAELEYSRISIKTQ